MRLERAKSSLSVAISAEGELQAVLALFNFEKQGAFSVREIEIARLFAGQLSALWSRKIFEERLVLQAQELGRKNEILSEMLSFMKTLLDPDHKFDYAAILNKAVELVPGAQKGSLLLREGGVFVFKAAVGYDLEKLAQVSLSEEELPRKVSEEIKIIKNLDELNRSRLSEEKLKIWFESGRKRPVKVALSMPLVVEGEVIGFFNLYNLEDPNAFGSKEVEIAQLFGEQVNLILERLQLEEKLREQSKNMEYLSCHDPLTNLLNRRAFQEMAQKTLALAHREGKSVFVLYLDLQNFKKFNDRFGHEAGDAVLKVVAERLRRSLRKNDLLARIGGDEFVVVLYGGSRDSVTEIVKRIIASLEEPFEWKGNSLRVSANVGIASYPEDGKSLEELIRKADFAMYKAKKEGLYFAFLEDENNLQ
ncbi:MAG: diguanylate cyclase [Candidatus Atribacteria bacterium]|nr:diguanylate cyclase [Candidatus Atribacteria bacterium]MCD6350228.1 diguanylate cyclase [Candidatus Atribacteria bacterium]